MPMPNTRHRCWLALTCVALCAQLLVACDPCAGVVGCVTSERVAIQGRLVDVIDARAVGSARVWLVRSDGTARDSAATTTDGGGNFQVSLSTESGTFDIGISPPGLAPYVVHNVQLASSTRSGDGNVLGVWVNRPVFGTALELIHRDGTPVTSGTVTFRRTGGVALSGPGLVDGVFTSGIDGGGRVAFLSNVYAAGADNVVGVLTVDAGDRAGPSVFADFSFAPSYVFRARDVRRLAVGARLDWHLLIYNRATAVGVPGTTVSFQRTGGIATSPESFTLTTDAAGQLVFPLAPLQAGTVVGDITVQPPPPAHSYRISGLLFQSFEDDAARSIRIGVGPHLPWLGVVRCNAKPLKGATVTATRVGGIGATPSTMVLTSDDNGYFSLMFKPEGYGDLIVDLEVAAPVGSGCIGFVQHDLHLPTLDVDSDARFIAAWDLPKR
jgi:hypothetical protein